MGCDRPRDEVIAIRLRSCETADFVCNSLHYLALLEYKTNVLDQAAPLDKVLIRS